MSTGRTLSVWRQSTIVFPVVQGSLFITALIRGRVSGDVPSDRAVKADDLLVGIEERFWPSVSRQHTDDMCHTCDDTIAKLVVLVHLRQGCTGGFCIVACRGWRRNAARQVVLECEIVDSEPRAAFGRV